MRSFLLGIFACFLTCAAEAQVNPVGGGILGGKPGGASSCGGLSDAGTGCSTTVGTSATVNTGTSGATIPLNNGAPTESGLWTFTNPAAITGSTETWGNYFNAALALPGSANSGAITSQLRLNQSITGNGSNLSGGDLLQFYGQNIFSGTGTLPYLKAMEMNAVNNSAGTISDVRDYYSNVSNNAGGTETNHRIYSGQVVTNNGTITNLFHFYCDSLVGGQTAPTNEYCIDSEDTAQKSKLAGSLSVGKLTINSTVLFPTSDSSADQSIAIGDGTLAGQTVSANYRNTAVGAAALSGTMTTAAVRNTAVGFNAGANITSGTLNTFIGSYAGGNAPQSVQNDVFIGDQAGYSATGSGDIAIGISALTGSTGNNNVGIGYLAGFAISSGTQNTAFGSNSMAQGAANITASNNSAFGNQSGYLLQGAATQNTMVGSLAGSSVTTGSANTVLGYNVASSTLTTGSDNILIGVSSAITTAASGTNNTINIGGTGGSMLLATGTDTNTTANVTVHGNVLLPEVTTGTNTDFVCMASGNKLTLQSTACTISQRHLKEKFSDVDITQVAKDLWKLKPQLFNLIETEPPNPDRNYSRPQYGLIAEEVADVDSHLAVYEDDMTTPKSYRQESILALLLIGYKIQQYEIAGLFIFIFISHGGVHYLRRKFVLP